MSPNKQTVQKYMDAFADVVIAEGAVRCARNDGGLLNAVFCDVFVMQGTKIRHLTSYLMEVNA